MRNFNIVVGSWGSYNACNDRALGSDWVDLSYFDDVDELRDELTRQGFELNGIDEELFIQDADGCLSGVNGDTTNPLDLFETLKDAGILDDEDAAERFAAYSEINGFDCALSAIERDPSALDDVIIYRNMSMLDVTYHLVDELYGYELEQCGHLANYFDYEAFARDLSFDGFYEFSGGVVEFR